MKFAFVIIMLAMLIPACTNISRDRYLLEYLSIEECVDKRGNSSGFNKDKSYELLRNECEQLQALEENHQKIAKKGLERTEKLPIRMNKSTSTKVHGIWLLNAFEKPIIRNT